MQVVTLQEYIEVALAADYPAGIYPETKFPQWHDKYLLKGETTISDIVLDVLTEYGYKGALGSRAWKQQPVFIQSFEVCLQKQNKNRNVGAWPCIDVQVCAQSVGAKRVWRAPPANILCAIRSVTRSSCSKRMHFSSTLSALLPVGAVMLRITCARQPLHSHAKIDVVCRVSQYLNLKYLSKKTELPLIFLLRDKPTSLVFDVNKTVSEFTSDAGLKDVASFAAGIGPSKDLLIPPTPERYAGTSIGLTARCHELGLQVRYLNSNLTAASQALHWLLYFAM